MQTTRDIDAYTKNYLSHDFEEIQVKYRRQKVISIIDALKPKNILEIGCGMAPLFQGDIDFDTYTIVEPSATFCRNAESVSTNKQIFILDDFFENVIDKIGHNKYDFIILSGLLHEVSDPDLLLDGVHKIANSESTIHVNVPNAKSLHRILAYEAGMINSLYNLSESNIKLDQHNVFDLTSLTEIVKKHGFTIIDKGSYFIKPFTHKQMHSILKNNIIDLSILDGLNNLSNYLPEYGSEIFVNVRLQ